MHPCPPAGKRGLHDDYQTAGTIEIGVVDPQREPRPVGTRDAVQGLRRAPPHLGHSGDAGRTGLRTGAVTGIIDRLEAAGWVRRERDPGDGRRVIVTPALAGERLRRVERVFEPVARALDELLDRYSERGLVTVLDFVERSRTLVDREVERLRGSATRSTDLVG